MDIITTTDDDDDDDDDDMPIDIIPNESEKDCNTEENSFELAGDTFDDANDDTIAMECMPSDALDVLISYLSVADYTILRLVSTKLRTIVADASHLYLEELKYYSSRPASSTSTKTTTEATTLSRDRSVTTLAVRGGTTTACLDPVRLMRLLDRYPCVNVARLANLSPVGDALIPILNAAPSAPFLHSLHLSGAHLSYWCLDALELPHLRRLTISGGSVRCSLLDLMGMSSSSKKKKHPCGGLLPKLECLTIERSNFLRDDQIMQVVMKNRNNHNNSTNNCRKSAFQTTNNGNNSSRRYPSWNQQRLRKLHLLQCLRLRNPVFQNPHLESLRLVACFGLQSLPHLDCPQLLRLDLSFCVRIESAAVQQAIDALPHLEHLQLVKCSGLTHLEIKSAKLTNLRSIHLQLSNRLVGCQLLNCPRLETVELSGCTALRALVLQSQALQILDVSNLPLTRLELNVPNLKYLDVSYCRRLDDHTMIRCDNLELVHYERSRIVALRFCPQVRRAIMKRWTLPILARSSAPSINGSSSSSNNPRSLPLYPLTAATGSTPRLHRRRRSPSRTRHPKS